MTDDLTFDSRSQPLACRAVSHVLGRAAALGLILLCGACGGDRAEGGAHAANGPAAGAVDARLAAEREALPRGTEDQDMADLVLAFTPLAATLTSDNHDRWLVHQREVQERVHAGGPVLGLRALEAFRASMHDEGSVRSAYLEVAAYCAPASTAPVLEELIVTYHAGKLLRVRTEAVRLLADTSPARAVEFLEPLVLDERPNNTRPSQEALMDGWARAAATLGIDQARVPAEVATNLFQPPEARYRAILVLGRLGTPLARSALRELFVEGTSDGLIRRKAAQGLVACLPPEELCPVLVEVSEHESDEHFLNFIGDMIERNCGG